jgi:signal transduction histidine kinase
LRATSVEGDDLAVAIRTLAEQLARDRSGDDLVICVDVQGTPRPLRPVVRDEIYQIGGEALRNCLRHAHASRVEVELRYDQGQLRLRVRDNGTGIDPKSWSDNAAAGHFGLRGMRERAELIGGKLSIWTAAAAGTEIELRVAGVRAYTAATPRRFTWRLNRVLAKSSTHE